MSEAERDILRILDAAIAQIGSKGSGKTRRKPGEGKVLSSVTEIISGEYRSREFWLELHVIVGLALSEADCLGRRKEVFLREWQRFLRMGDDSHAVELLAILRRMRDNIAELDIALSRKDIDIGVAMYYDFLRQERRERMALTGEALERVVKFRDGVVRVLDVAKRNKTFIVGRKRKQPEWDDLNRLVMAFNEFHSDEDEKLRPDVYAIGEAMDRAAEIFDVKQHSSTTSCLARCFYGLLEGKPLEEYSLYRADMLLFLGRLRNSLDNRICWAKRKK